MYGFTVCIRGGNGLWHGLLGRFRDREDEMNAREKSKVTRQVDELNEKIAKARGHVRSLCKAVTLITMDRDRLAEENERLREFNALMMEKVEKLKKELLKLVGEEDVAAGS